MTDIERLKEAFENSQIATQYWHRTAKLNESEIIKLQAEIRHLKEDNLILSQKRAYIFEIGDSFERGRINGIKAFAERLKDKVWDADTRCGYVQVVDVGDIDDLLKEMEGENR